MRYHMTRNNITSNLCGELKWYSDHECWGGFVSINQSDIPITVIPEEGDDSVAQDYVDKLLEDLLEYEYSFREYITKSLLPIYNDEWHHMVDDGPELSDSEFMSRLSLTMIQIVFGNLNSPDQKEWYGEFIYNPDDMFTEHHVSLFVDSNIHLDKAVIG